MQADKIVRSRRQSIGVTISPQGEIIVHAPPLIPKFFIERFLDEKKDWIIRALEKVQKHPKASKKDYQEGDKFLFLGKEYPLHFSTVSKITITDKICVPLGLQFRIKKELTNWYVASAKEKIMQRLDFYTKQMGTSYKSVMFSDTSSKWGSCKYDNSLQFRWKLIMTPLMVLDYVVIHELAHTIEHNHSDAFWRIVRRFTPAYKQHKKWLEEHAGLLVV